MATKSINDRLGDGGFTSVAVFSEDAGIVDGLVAPDGTVFQLAEAYPVELFYSSAIASSCTSTAIDEPLASYIILSGNVGNNSILQIEPLWTHTNSVNNKILKVKIGGVTVYSATRTTTTTEAPLIVLANRNSLSSQIKPYDSLYFTGGSGTPSTYTIDFSNDVLVEITGQRANSGDTLTLEYFRILHFVGD